MSAEQVEVTDVFEVYGATAVGLGWDFLVCKSMRDALNVLHDDLDILEDGEEVRVVFRRYSKEQMEDVVYE